MNPESWALTCASDWQQVPGAKLMGWKGLGLGLGLVDVASTAWKCQGSNPVIRNRVGVSDDLQVALVPPSLGTVGRV